MIFSESIFMILALYEARRLWKATVGLRGAKLVKVLIQDQAFFFLACADIPLIYSLKLTLLTSFHAVLSGLVS